MATARYLAARAAAIPSIARLARAMAQQDPALV
jgi:hypothetical protein